MGGGVGLRETEGVIRLDDGTELPRPQHLGPISREGYAQLQVGTLIVSLPLLIYKIANESQ